MSAKEAKEVMLGSDEKCVLQYLRNYRDAFITESEIARHAGGHTRFKQDEHWAYSPLARLLELRLVDTDGIGRYHMHESATKYNGSRIKFLAPELRDILEHSGILFDLSRFD